MRLGQPVHVKKLFAPAALLLRPARCAGIAVRLVNRDVGHFGQLVQGFPEGDAMVFHPEVEDVAVLLAAETVEVSVGIDGKGRLGFLMEGAGGHETASDLLQWHEAVDEFNDIYALFDERNGVAAPHVPLL